MEILTAFIFMLIVALAAGALLIVFSHLFAIKKNPVEKAVRECLPGINCGACGYKGCDDYAAALAEGEEKKANLCVPGTQSVADSISEILGIEKVQVKDVVAFVACNGKCGAVSHTAHYEGVESCRAASMLYGGTSSCKFGCLGYGDCAAACPSGAISIIDGVAHVDTSVCVGCELCRSVCPKQIITMLPQESSVAVMCSNKQKGAQARQACQNACIACKKCEKVCPSGAISVIDNLAQIDYDKCIDCGQCADACPTGCLKKVHFADLPEGYDVKALGE